MFRTPTDVGYWNVVNRSAPNNIFAMPAAAYITPSDPIYQEWLTKFNPEMGVNNRATVIASDGELAEVLNNVGCAASVVLAAAGATPNWGPAGGMTNSQIADVLLSLGIVITSTGSGPALNGQYSCDTTTQADLTSIAAYIAKNGTFPGGGSTFPWSDIEGNAHVFPSTAEFSAFETAVGNYIVEVSFAAKSPTPTWPSNAFTIP